MLYDGLKEEVPRSSLALRDATLLVMPLTRYTPCENKPYFSMAWQHFNIIEGTSTLSRAICSARSTPKVGRPLSTIAPRFPFVPTVGGHNLSLKVGRGGN